MLKKILSRVSVALSFVLLLAPVSLLTPLKASAQSVPTAYSSITVKVNNVSFSSLYNFTTDLHNDSSWFPNVASTVQTQNATNPPSKVGIEYNQISFFGDIELDTHVVVKHDINRFLFYIEGTGPVANYNALYTFAPGANGSGTFTLSTKFVSPGITSDVLTFLLTQAMQNILNHFNTTGTIHMNFMYIV